MNTEYSCSKNRAITTKTVLLFIKTEPQREYKLISHMWTFHIYLLIY